MRSLWSFTGGAVVSGGPVLGMLLSDFVILFRHVIKMTKNIETNSAVVVVYT